MKHRINRGRINDLRSEVTQLHRLGKRQMLNHIGRIDYPWVGRHEAIDIGPNLELRSPERRSQNGRRVVRPAPPQVGHVARRAVRSDKARNHRHPG